MGWCARSSRRRARNAAAVAGVRLGPPVPRPVSVIGVGRNYGEAAPGEPPPVPILFAKPATVALVGPEDPIVRPADDGAARLRGRSWRSSSGVPAGTSAPEDAAAHIAGYTVASDVTAFDLMFPGHDEIPRHVRAPAPAAARQGPRHVPAARAGIVTADEAGDPDELEIITTVNGEERQRARAGAMLVGIPRLVSEVERRAALHPGDVILTGTPPGSACSRTRRCSCGGGRGRGLHPGASAAAQPDRRRAPRVRLRLSRTASRAAR